MIRSRFVLIALLALSASLSARQPPASPEPAAAPEAPVPRQPAAAAEPAVPPEPAAFRGGANLVRVDTYVTHEGAPVLDLTVADFEVLEDDVPQRVEAVELVHGSPDAPPDPPRLFVLFFDVWHAPLADEPAAAGPTVALLDRVITRQDMVGFMTPEMSARNLTFTRKADTIDGLLKNSWLWSERSRVAPDPREQEIAACYPDEGATAGIAADMVARRRERKTLDALDDLVGHLERTRRYRTYVVVLSEGWPLFPRDERLARELDRPSDAPPQAAGGRPSRGAPRSEPALSADATLSTEACDRERSLLAFSDDAVEFRRLLQRANRANVSFYPIEAGGLTRQGTTAATRPQASARNATTDPQTPMHDVLREMAGQTDGTAVIATADVEPAVARMQRDAGAYYLLSYYSTNTRLDGRFRRVSVRVNRAGADARSRPGYLAPTEADMASDRVDALMKGAPPGYSTRPPPVAVARALGQPGLRTAALRLDAVGGAGRLWLTLELDRATARRTEWQAGGQGRVVLEHENGDLAPITTDVTLAPGERTLALVRPEGSTLAPGRYVVRLQLSPQGTGTPIQATVAAIVPDGDALMARSAVASRRGPSTGLVYQRTADARFRRTERLRLEIPRFADAARVSAQLLNSQGTPMALPIAVTDRADSAMQLHFIVADLTLAPLAQGNYALEVTAEADGRQEEVRYEFSIVP